MRKVIAFFGLVGLISLPLVAGLAVSAATGARARHHLSAASYRAPATGPGASSGGTIKVPAQSR